MNRYSLGDMRPARDALGVQILDHGTVRQVEEVSSGNFLYGCHSIGCTRRTGKVVVTLPAKKAWLLNNFSYASNLALRVLICSAARASLGTNPLSLYNRYKLLKIAQLKVDRLLRVDPLEGKAGCGGIKVGKLNGGGLLEFGIGLDVWWNQLLTALRSPFVDNITSDGTAFKEDKAVVVL